MYKTYKIWMVAQKAHANTTIKMIINEPQHNENGSTTEVSGPGTVVVDDFSSYCDLCRCAVITNVFFCVPCRNNCYYRGYVL